MYVLLSLTSEFNVGGVSAGDFDDDDDGRKMLKKRT